MSQIFVIQNDDESSCEFVLLIVVCNMLFQFRPRQRKDKHKILEKIHFDFYRYIICLAILAFTLLPLFLSWGALELEGEIFTF